MDKPKQTLGGEIFTRMIFFFLGIGVISGLAAFALWMLSLLIKVAKAF